jgi:hypothetical protein
MAFAPNRHLETSRGRLVSRTACARALPRYARENKKEANWQLSRSARLGPARPAQLQKCQSRHCAGYQAYGSLEHAYFLQFGFPAAHKPRCRVPRCLLPATKNSPFWLLRTANDNVAALVSAVLAHERQPAGCCCCHQRRSSLGASSRG